MGNSTINPAPPNVANLGWRPITRDDVPSIVDLASACFLVDGGLHFLFEPESVSLRCFPEAPGVAIGAFAPDERLAACATVHLGGEAGSPQAVIVGYVRPEVRSQGLGTYLMRWSQEQGQTLLTGVPSDQRVLQVRTESLTESAHRLYTAHDFQRVFEELVMRRDLRLPLPDGQLPHGVTLTTWQAELASQFFLAYDTAFRERPGFPGWTAAEWVESWTTDDFMPGWSLLARAADVPAGFLTAATNPPHGFIMQVGVIPSQRRRGLASALMVEAMRRMQAAGAVSVQLAVHTNNPGAIRAYDKLGFTTIGRRARYERRAG